MRTLFAVEVESITLVGKSRPVDAVILPRAICGGVFDRHASQLEGLAGAVGIKLLRLVEDAALFGIAGQTFVLAVDRVGFVEGHKETEVRIEIKLFVNEIDEIITLI